MAALEARSLLTRETIRSLDALYPAGVGGIIGMVGGLRLERWAPSRQNAGRHQIGIGGRLTSESAQHVVYLDALIPEDGDTAFALLPPGLADSRRAAAREQGRGLALPVPGPDAFPIPDGPAKDWFMRRLCPQPVGSYDSPIRLARPAGAGLPVTYVAYTDPPLASIEPSRRRARSKPGWRYLELAVPYDVQVATPGVVVDLLAGIG